MAEKKLFGLDYTNVERYLESYGNYIIRQGESILSKRTNTGNLSRSLDFTVFKTKKGYDIRWTAASYGEFVDKGVSGVISKRYYYAVDGKRKRSPYRYITKGPPQYVLRAWIKMKGIKGRQKKGASKGKGGQFMSRESLAFLMSRSIKNKGLKAMSFYSQPIAYSFKVFKKQLEDNLAKDLEIGLSVKI
jgi:hypothetical protein